MQIRAPDIDFWEARVEVMKLKHETNMYPPRVKMTVTMRNPENNIKLPIKFEGCSSDSQLNTDIIFPLGFPSSTLSSSASSGSQADYYSYSINALGESVVL